jgi:type II secretory pathway component PulJ
MASGDASNSRAYRERKRTARTAQAVENAVRDDAAMTHRDVVAMTQAMTEMTAAMTQMMRHLSRLARPITSSNTDNETIRAREEASSRDDGAMTHRDDAPMTRADALKLLDGVPPSEDERTRVRRLNAEARDQRHNGPPPRADLT